MPGQKLLLPLLIQQLMCPIPSCLVKKEHKRVFQHFSCWNEATQSPPMKIRKVKPQLTNTTIMPFYTPPWTELCFKQGQLQETKNEYHQHATELYQTPFSPFHCCSSLSTHSKTPQFEAIPTYLEGSVLTTDSHRLHLLNHHQGMTVYTGFACNVCQIRRV